jgi:hypothetical protein
MRMEEGGKACKKLRMKHNVTDTQFENECCEDLACNEECTSLDPDTLTGKEQEIYLSEILRGKTAKDLLEEFPKFEEIVLRHYAEKMYDMKAEDVKKRRKAARN